MTMKILTISGNPWDNTNSVGNTLSNFFSGFDAAEFASIFLRELNPNNEICKSYYRITDKMLLKHLFAPQKIGCEFSALGQENMRAQTAGSEKRAISLIHRYNLRFIYSFERMLWRLKGWKNKKLASFVKDFNPDVIFSFAIPSVPNFLMLNYLKSCTDANIVLFIADNVYGKFFDKNGSKKPEAKRFCRMMGLADKIYGASEEICRVYGKEFGVKIAPLYKGCDFTCSVKKTVTSPVSIAYAGNLLYGRLDTLAKLANEIAKLNDGNRKYALKIFSGTLISAAEKEALNIPGSSEFCGLRKYEEIKQILGAADIVLHVESFEPLQMQTVKYSFSTKIIDCLQSGSALMVIGPRGISSVEYPKRIPGAIVIDDLNQIGSTLQDVINHASCLTERAAAVRSFAEKHHSHEALRRQLQADFEALTQKAE